MTPHAPSATALPTADARLLPPRGLAAFFTIAFAFSWLVWWAGPLMAPGASSTMALVILGSFGPAVAATVVTARLDGRAGLRALFGRYLPRRQGGGRPFIIGALIFVALVASGGIALLAGGALDIQGLGTGIAALPGMIVLIALVGGGNEELGWRGFALPRLQAALPPVAANVMLGIIWAVWHAPLWSMATAQSAISFPIYVILVVAIAIVLGFVFNIAGGGLLSPSSLRTPRSMPPPASRSAPSAECTRSTSSLPWP